MRYCFEHEVGVVSNNGRVYAIGGEAGACLANSINKAARSKVSSLFIELYYQWGVGMN
jgi:hypothetical protein